eukprot:3389686-Pyramimonas_sp.AAC.1
MSRRTSQEIIGKEISCHLCESTEPCYKVAWGVMFGQACFAKVRANHRRLQQMPHGKQDVVDDKKQMIEDPGTWRRQEFFRSDEHRAQQKALARVTANFTEQTKIHQTVDVQDDVGVTKRKYKQLRTRGSQHAQGHTCIHPMPFQYVPTPLVE